MNREQGNHGNESFLSMAASSDIQKVRIVLTDLVQSRKTHSTSIFENKIFSDPLIDSHHIIFCL